MRRLLRCRETPRDDETGDDRLPQRRRGIATRVDSAWRPRGDRDARVDRALMPASADDGREPARDEQQCAVDSRRRSAWITWRERRRLGERRQQLPPPPPTPGEPVRLRTGMRAPRKIVQRRSRSIRPWRAASRVDGSSSSRRHRRHGQVESVRVLRSIPLLDQAAIDAVRQWQFTPTLLNGDRGADGDDGDGSNCAARRTQARVRRGLTNIPSRCSMGGASRASMLPPLITQATFLPASRSRSFIAAASGAAPAPSARLCVVRSASRTPSASSVLRERHDVVQFASAGSRTSGRT